MLFLKLSFVNDIASAEQADLFKSIVKDLGVPKAINFDVNTLRFELREFYHVEMPSKHAVEIANNVEPEQAAPLGGV